MARLKPDPPRGIVGRPGVEPRVRHRRYLVDPPLDAQLEHWWTVAWDLPPGERLDGSTLSHPCFHVVVEAGRARVAGVPRARFRRALEGTGRVFGAKFRPGAFRVLLDGPASAFTDRVVPFSEVVGKARARAYERAIEAAPDDDARVVVATRFFRALLPPPPPDARLLQELVEAAASDRHLTTVEALRARSGLHLRELQRWFKDAVGVGPKWVIQRYRLHEALAALEAGRGTVATLAADLGYADQAHFTRDFKRVVGMPPSHYARTAGAPASGRRAPRRR